MPFDGNCWNQNKFFSSSKILNIIEDTFGVQNILKLKDPPNNTAKTYKIIGHDGTFSFIDTLTNPFCSTCNRLRVTADGRLKNCLFSSDEIDLLTLVKQEKDLSKAIRECLKSKKHTRAGMENLDDFKSLKNHENNRSMIAIGG